MYKELRWGDEGPIRERLLEHRRAALNRDMQNPWGAHYGTEHIGESVPEIPFSVKIVRRARDHVDRKLREAIKIDSPSIEH